MERLETIASNSFQQAKDTLAKFFAAKDKVAPAPPIIKLCGLCFESGATKRICCYGLFCDHCYTKDKMCPNCKAATRVEKMTGATYMLPAFSENEECRCCLDPGLKRRCCGSYYCDDCYYKIPYCRICEKPVGKKGGVTDEMKATILAIVLGIFVTLIIVCAVAVALAILGLSEQATPVGINGYKCYGFFTKCDRYLCFNADDTVRDGSSTLPALTSYEYCDDKSTTKIQGNACVFDEELWTSTNGGMGFDLCQDDFYGGVMIFEDTFDSWKNYTSNSNTMKSALWEEIVNGYSTSFCGVATQLGGEKALTFSGPFFRHAETKDVDLTSGGWLEAELFISPAGFDVYNPNCKSSYAGVVKAAYSIDGGVTWTVLKEYDARTYKSESFFYIRLPIPSNGWTSSTRFKFEQTSFEANRDSWALDNVRVLRYLPSNWNTVGGFIDNLQSGFEIMQQAQCCFDTDWCQTRLTEAQMDSCKESFSWYNGRRFLLRGAELYIVIATLVTVIKFVYLVSQELIMIGRFPFQDEYDMLLNFDKLIKLIPAKYRPRRRVEDYTSNVHKSARLVAEMRAMLADEEGEGEMVRTKEDIRSEKEKEKARIKAEKRKLKKRKLKKNKKCAGLKAEELKKALDEMSSSSDEEDEEKELDVHAGMTDNFATDVDKFKRSNVASFRTPFDISYSQTFRQVVMWTVLGVYGVIVLIKISTTSYYIISQKVAPFGLYAYDIAFTSLGINFFALCLDGHSIFLLLKNTFPIINDWLPLITVDTSENINTLYIGHHQVLLASVTETSPFSQEWIAFCACGYLLAAFPWCLLSLILRDRYLVFYNMRITSPFFGVIMFCRAVLGPSFVLKIVWSLLYLLDPSFKIREAIGRAFQRERTSTTSINTALIFVCVFSFFGGIVANDFLQVIAGGAFGFGIFYGALTGCIHSLPIRPWMCITMLQQGVWLRVSKKRSCPCSYYGKYCTDMHSADEVFVVFTTDDVKFISLVKSAAASQASQA